MLPDDLAQHLDGYVSGKDAPGDRLVAMLDGLKKEGYISHGLDPDEPASRSGHAADRITELFTDPRMIGDAEQYSVAAALMARQLGFPARVVFGFVPQGSASTLDVTGADVSAWIEVDTAQYGWVTIDPNPPVRPIPEEQPQDPDQDRAPAVDRAAAADKVGSETEPDDAGQQPERARRARSRSGGAASGAPGRRGRRCSSLLILAAPFLLIIAAKVAQTRIRRRADSALQRIRGGWDEFADAVVDHGFAAPAGGHPVRGGRRRRHPAVARARRGRRPRRVRARRGRSGGRRPRLGCRRRVCAPRSTAA